MRCCWDESRLSSPGLRLTVGDDAEAGIGGLTQAVTIGVSVFLVLCCLLSIVAVTCLIVRRKRAALHRRGVALSTRAGGLSSRDYASSAGGGHSQRHGSRSGSRKASARRGVAGARQPVVM
jgi:hypothetical protein